MSITPFLILLIIFLYTFQSLFTRFYTANYAGADASMATPVFTVCYGAFIGLATLAVNGFVYQPQWQTLVFGLCNALMLWLYNVALLEAGKRGSYAFLMICMLFGAILLPLLVDTLFLGAQISVVQIIAIGVMLCAFVAMNARGMSFKGAGKAYYIWCAMLFLSNGMYATILNLQESTMGPGQNSEMVITAYLGTAVIVSLAQLLSGRGKKLAQGLRMGKKAALFALGSSTCATVAANLCLYLLGLVEASVLYTIDNGGVLVMSAICSCVLFRERLRWEQILGVVLAALSIVMITQG